MEAVFAAIRPGMTDLEVAGVAEQYGHTRGSEQGLFLCASGPVGTSTHPFRCRSGDVKSSVRQGFGSEPVSSIGTSCSGSRVGSGRAAITCSADAMPMAPPDVCGTVEIALRRAIPA